MVQGNIRNSSVAIGTANVEVSPAQERKELILTNTSTGGQNITVSFGETAAAGAGIVLTPYAVYSTATASDAPNEAVFAVASAASATLAITER